MVYATREEHTNSQDLRCRGAMLDNMRITEEDISYKAVTFYENDVPIGCGDIEIHNDEIWLNHFAVREDYRGRGYGQKLLQVLIDKYGVNTLTCDIENEVAFHIYKKFGFEVIEAGNSFDDGEVFLMKRVSGG